MNSDIKKLLLELPKTSHGQALRVYLNERYDEIDSVEDVESIEDAKGKKIALKILKGIFNFYVDNSGTPNAKTRYD